MIQLSGQNEVRRKGLLDFLKDPSSFSRCIPNLESIEIRSPNEFDAKFKVEVPEEFGVSYLKTIGIKMHFIVSSSGNKVNMHGEGRSMGLKVKIDIEVEVYEREETSTMSWKASVDVGLLERMLGEDKIKEFSDEIISQLVLCISS